MDGSTLIVALGALTLLIRAALALYATGLSRSKNAASAVTRQVCDLCVAALAFWAVGQALFEYAGTAPLGLRPGRLIDWAGEAGPLTFHHLTLVLLATGVVGGAAAERSRLWPTLAISAVMAAVVVPVAGQWVWGGWLGDLGFRDSAGAAVVHLTAGAAAAACAILVGPRNGKYNRDGSANFIPGHSVPLTTAGVLTILALWVPYVALTSGLNYGPATQVALNVVLAAASAGFIGLIVSQLRFGKPDVMLLNSAILGGLVAISAGAGFVGTIGAVLIGGVAGWLVPFAIVRLDLNARIDDPAGAVAIHGVGAAWGLLATALLAAAPWSDRLRSLGVQALGVAVVAVAALVPVLIVLFALRATVGLRSKEVDEFDGLDLAEHDVNAYPDFQQTMIKSYHLREA